MVEDLAAPDPVGLVALDRAGQAGPAHRAAAAVHLGLLQVGGLLGEPQLRVLTLAREQFVEGSGPPGEQDQGDKRHGALPAAASRPGRRVVAGLVPAGHPVGVHDVGIPGVSRQRFGLRPARSVTALADLSHERVSFARGSEHAGNTTKAPGAGASPESGHVRWNLPRRRGTAGPERPHPLVCTCAFGRKTSRYTMFPEAGHWPAAPGGSDDRLPAAGGMITSPEILSDG